MKTAIVYDRVNKWGGAERVLLALHEMFPDAPLYTSVYNQNKAGWVNVFPKVVTSFLQDLPILRNYHELLGWLTPLAYESFNFDEYDLVISVTSEAAKGIITKPKTKHICYCLTPTRYLWSGYKEYLENPPRALSWIPFYKYVSQPFLRYAKVWDKIAAQRPDVYVAISSAVKDRITNYYGRVSQVVYPPVEIEKFVNKYPDVPASTKSDIDYDVISGKEKYYLIVSRLVPYKKVDLAVEVFNELGLPLIVVGTGSEESKLKSISRKNISFAGFVPDDELMEYYKNAKALIMPQEEDFGLVAVEAQAAGVAVIAYKKGGALDTAVEGRTGLFFSKQSTKSLIDAVKRFSKIKFNKKVIMKNAEKFSKRRFKKEFRGLVEKHMSSHLQ